MICVQTHIANTTRVPLTAMQAFKSLTLRASLMSYSTKCPQTSFGLVATKKRFYPGQASKDACSLYKKQCSFAGEQKLFFALKRAALAQGSGVGRYHVRMLPGAQVFFQKARHA